MSTTQAPEKGFFASLLDFGFTSFITLRFLRVIYVVLGVMTLLTAVVMLVLNLSRGGTTAVVAVFLVPIFTLLYLIMIRVYLEVIALFFRIGENISVMAAAAGGVDPNGGGGQYGAPGPYSGPDFSAPARSGPFAGPAR
jgi:Domain of unknown function (DUF4282)